MSGFDSGSGNPADDRLGALTRSRLDGDLLAEKTLDTETRVANLERRRVLPAFSGTNIDDVILSSIPDAFWKLDETSGVIAHDSSGNGWDLSVPSGFVAPTWGQPSGPPGAVTATFIDGIYDRLSRTVFPAYSGDFTAMLWARPVVHTSPRLGGSEHFLIGQGQASGAFQNGWAIVVGGAASLQPNKLRAYINHGAAGPAAIYGSNVLDLTGSIWYQFALTRTAGLFRLFQDGLVQADTTSAPYTAAGGISIADDGSNAPIESAYPLQGGASYAAVWGRALTSTELIAMIDAATGSLPAPSAPEAHAGEVLTVGPDGQPVWETPSVTVEHGDGTPDSTPTVGPSFGGATSTSGWHLAAHTEVAVLYDSSPGRFDVPSQKWVRVPFNTVRFWRTWEPTVGAANTKTEWLPDDRGLTAQAQDGILHIAAGMEGVSGGGGYHQHVVYWPWSPEWPFLDWSKLPNSPVSPPGIDPSNIDAYARAARCVDLSHGFVLRDSTAGASARQFFEWTFWNPADGTPEWVSYLADNPYPIYPVWPQRPLTLAPPYPKLSEKASGQYYAPQKTVATDVTLAAGSNLCVQAWQDSPWPLRFSTDTYRIPYPSLIPKYVLRPHLALSYQYDPETINHTTGKLL